MELTYTIVMPLVSQSSMRNFRKSALASTSRSTVISSSSSTYRARRCYLVADPCGTRKPTGSQSEGRHMASIAHCTLQDPLYSSQ